MTECRAGVPQCSRPAFVFALLLTGVFIVGFVNAGVFTGRAVMRARSDYRGGQQRTAEELARSLQGTHGSVALILPDRLPADMRLRALAFELRLRYTCYPRSIHVIRIPSVPQSPISGHPISDTALHHDLAAIVMVGTETGVPPGWTLRRYPGSPVALRETGTLSDGHPRRARDGIRMPWLIVGIAALYALGACICSLCGAPGLPWPARVGLRHLTGTTAMAVAVTVSHLALGRLTPVPAYAVLGLAALAAWRLRGRNGHEEQRTWTAPWDVRWARVAAWALLGLGMIGIVVTCLGTGLSWDGWTIWQIKARAFFHDGNLRFLGDAVHDFAHRDYPLLVPLHTWWVFAHAGADHDKLAQVAGMLFAADLLLLTYGLTRMLACRWAAVGVTALMAAQPTVIRHASSGYADVPLAAFLVGLAAVLSVGSSSQGVRRAVLIGIVAGGCALTKNEGVAAVVAVGALMAYRVVAARSGPPRIRCMGRLLAADRGREIRAMVVAMVVASVCIAPWLLLRSRLDLRSDIVGGSPYPVVEAALGPDRTHETRAPVARIPDIARAAASSLLSIGPRYPAWGLTWLFAVAGIVVGIRHRSVACCGPLLTLLAVQSIAYLLAYLRTPHALEWHLATSLDRLMMHLLPAALIAGMVALTRAYGSEACRMLDERGLQPETPG